MNDIITEIEERRAYRAIDSKSIGEDVIKRMMQAAVLAPSCFNNQPWRFIVVTESAMLDKVKEHLSRGNTWALKSPCIILVSTKADYDCDLSDRREYALFDTGLAAENLILQAFKEGLYAHPIAGFSPEPIKKICRIPEEVTLITCIICGYPGDISQLGEEKQAAEKAPRDRKPDEETICFNSWSFS